MSVYLIAVIIYLLFMAGIGVYFSRTEIQDGDDFMVAGRRLPLFVVIGTLLATFVGSGTVVGGASFIYQYGPFAAIFNLGGGIVGAIILYFIASKVRKSEIYTVPQLIEKRFGKVARFIASIIILFAFVGITAYQFTGGAYVLQLTTGMSLEWGAIIICILVIFLTVSGGLFSVAYSDALSAVLILLGFVIGVPLALNAAGGFENLSLSLPEHTKTWNGGLSVIQLLGFFLPLFLLILGDQNMYQRFSASKSEKVARNSILGFIFGNIMVVGLTIILATTAIVIFPDIEPDSAILTLAVKGLPIFIGVLILCSAVAFIITTATSYLLSASGNIVYDLYGFITKNKKPLSQKNTLWFSRITVVVLGLLAYVLGRFFPTVLEIQMYSYTMYGASITPAVLAAILWKRATTAGVLSSMILGGLSTIIWEMVLNRPNDWNSVIVALPISVAALIIVSLMTQKNDDVNNVETVKEA